MSFEQIRASPGEDHVIDEDAFLQTLRGEVSRRWRAKFGIIGSVTLGAAALISVVIAPWKTNGAPSIVPESVVSLALSQYTSPYYSKDGACLQGEVIPDKATCWKAFKLLFPGSKESDNKENRRSYNPGCMKQYGTNNGAEFNPNLGAQWRDNHYICKKKDDDLPDYAELQGDLDKLVVHCLEAAPDHTGFKNCVLQIKKWDRDAEQPEETDEAAKKSCAWTKNAGKYSGGYASGVSTKYDLAGAKKRCLELSECVAVTCPSSGDKCSVRRGALQDSDSGEVTYTRDC